MVPEGVKSGLLKPGLKDWKEIPGDEKAEADTRFGN